MSIFNDFFEQFRRRSEPRIPMDIPQDILNDLYNDSEESRRQESTYPGRRRPFSDYPMDFMSEFEEMFNNLFKGFPVMTFPLPNIESEVPSHPENEEIYDNKQTLQQRMLNDNTSHKTNRPSTLQSPRPHTRFNEPVTREDRNLDEDLSSGDKSLDDILPRGNVQTNPSPLRSFGSFTSSSVTRDRNGVVESKKTVRDSRGNEQVTIVRRVDGKEYTITHKTDEHGNKETEENIVDLGTEGKRTDVLTPKTQSPIKTDSLYGRIRNWFLNED